MYACIHTYVHTQPTHTHTHRRYNIVTRCVVVSVVLVYLSAVIDHLVAVDQINVTL